MAATTKKTQKADIEDARAKALNAFINKATKKNEGAVFTFNGRSLDVPSIPTGALSLDYALGIGGLPRGRIIEIYGPESHGKTSLALSVGAQSIKQGGMVGYVDVEHAIDPNNVTDMGIDLDYFALSQPSSGEEALQMVEEMVKEGIFDVIVVDSVAALVTQQELNGEIGDSTVGTQARLMSSALRRLVPIVAGSNAVVIFINQLREKIGVMHGNPETTPGGRALKFYASVRLSVRSPAGQNIKDPKDSKKVIGLGTTVTVVKNKVGPPQKKADYRLVFGQGIDAAASVFDVAKELGVLVEQPGYYYVNSLTGERISDDGVALRGGDKIKSYLSTHPAEAAELEAACRLAMKSEALPIGEEEPLPDEAFDPEIDGLGEDVA